MYRRLQHSSCGRLLRGWVSLVSCLAVDGLALLPSNGPEVAVPHQLVALFIPKPERERFETGKQRHGLHRLKQRLRVVAFLQMIIRNARTQMMDVMKPNAAGEP